MELNSVSVKQEVKDTPEHSLGPGKDKIHVFHEAENLGTDKLFTEKTTTKEHLFKTEDEDLSQIKENDHFNLVPNTRPKQYQCNICGYKNQKFHLRLHIGSVHLKLKRFKCPFCDYAGTLKKHLKDHIGSVHNNLKQHKCHLCDFASNQRKNLKRHVEAVHLKLKQHKCNFCDYASNVRSALKRHVESVHMKYESEKTQVSLL